MDVLTKNMVKKVIVESEWTVESSGNLDDTTEAVLRQVMSSVVVVVFFLKHCRQQFNLFIHPHIS